MHGTPLSKDDLTKIIEENGYIIPKFFDDGRVACIMPLMFTYAIVSDINQTGYEDRWCYHSLKDAQKALAEWDGEDGTEPNGWHRHPATGRRREGGKEWVNH